jgi:hypothetical protein
MIMGATSLLHERHNATEEQISSAVSTVLRSQEFPFADAAGAEHCGYGDLR